MDNIRGKTIAITGAARGIGYATAKALLARGARVVIGDRDVALGESAVADLTRLGQVSGYPLDVTDRESFATFIDIASLSGLIPVPGQVVYVGAKFGVVGLSAALADEVAPHGVDVSVVMPPFTNTELISGTKSCGAIKPVEPEDIAAAVIKTLEKPKTHVSVPTPLRFTAQAAQMLGPRGRRWLNKRLGLDRVFLDFDATARQGYEQRAQAAQGVVEGSEKG